MKNFGIALIVVGIVFLLLWLVGIGKQAALPLPIGGVIALLAGVVLYRRNRGAVPRS